MSQQCIRGEGEDGDENWCSGPEVYTQSIQVLPPLQALQLLATEFVDPVCKEVLPRIELQHTNTTEHLIHQLVKKKRQKKIMFSSYLMIYV